MKNFQQNLLIVLALGLCGLCAWQWYAQTLQRNEIEKLNRLVYDRDVAIQGYTNSIATLNHQVNQMDARLIDLKAAAATNDEKVAAQTTEIAQLRSDNAACTNEIAQYKTAVDTLQAKLKEAYAGIDQQNEAITNLITQRNALAQKYNDEVKDRNEVVAKYNDLAKQVEKLQGDSKKE
jgi:chromosome segregation ATPase